MNFNRGKSIFEKEKTTKENVCFAFFSTTVAVAGDDYVVVASDTRLTENYAIQSRTHSNIYKMFDEKRKKKLFDVDFRFV